MIWGFAAIAVCVLFSALFSGAEIGFYSVNRLRLRSRVEEGSRRARVLLRLLERPDTTMMTTLIGTNIMVYAASALATKLCSGWRPPELIATAIMTPVIFVFAEMIPKDVFHRRADSFMYVLAGPIDALCALVWPVTSALRWLVAVLTGGGLGERRAAVFSRAALAEWIAEGEREGVLTRTQQAMAANVMGLMQRRVAAVMIPFEAAAVVPADKCGPALCQAVAGAGYSRLPVVTGAEKSIVGILHTLDCIRPAGRGRSAAELARPAIEVSQDDGVTSVLLALQRARSQMAVVVDADGRATGIVTVKDLVEEIVGELQDF